MLKSDKLFESSSSLVASIAFIFLGIVILVGSNYLYNYVIDIFIYVLFLVGFVQFFQYFFSKQADNEKKITFNRCFFHLLFCLVLSLIPSIPRSIIPIIFALYFILNGVIKAITYIMLFSEKANGRIKELVASIFYFGFGIPLLFSPLKNLNMMLIFTGVYLILLGVTYLFDFCNVLMPRRVKNKLKRRFRFTLPVFLEAIIPYQVLNEINYFIDKEQLDKKFVYDEKKENIEPDMEVFVHVSNNGFNRMGHVDLCYKGTVISYGNYDDASIHFFNTMGDGVVFTTNKDDYIPFCISHSHKTLFGFGLKLTDAQKENIEKYISSLFENLYEWKSPYQRNIKSKRIRKGKYGDYASSLYRATKADFYKFYDGKFKRYFVLGVNCCLLADSIIGKSGIDLLKMNGLITPGAYYEYLNREFRKKNSMVVSRTIYNKISPTNPVNTKNRVIKNFSR